MQATNQTRRHFVRNTLATTVTVSLGGLIRAHGSSGGGETTTYNPWGTTVETTFEDTTLPYDTTVPPSTEVPVPKPYLLASHDNDLVEPDNREKGGGSIVVKKIQGSNETVVYSATVKWVLAWTRILGPAIVGKKKKDCLLLNLSNVSFSMVLTNENGTRPSGDWEIPSFGGSFKRGVSVELDETTGSLLIKSASIEPSNKFKTVPDAQPQQLNGLGDLLLQLEIEGKVDPSGNAQEKEVKWD